MKIQCSSRNVLIVEQCYEVKIKMNEEKHEEKSMIERYDFHRKQHEKWFGIAMIFACFGGALPPLLLFLIFPFIRMSKHAKIHKQIQKDCFLKSMENGVDKEKYEKRYQYMQNQKRWWG